MAATVVNKADVYLLLFRNRQLALPYLHFLLRFGDGCGWPEFTQLDRLRLTQGDDGAPTLGDPVARYLASFIATAGVGVVPEYFQEYSIHLIYVAKFLKGEHWSTLPHYEARVFPCTNCNAGLPASHNVATVTTASRMTDAQIHCSVLLRKF